jgi:hypothetical protein
MQVLGLCRFSWPALGGFKTEHATPEERVRFLYAPARIEARLRLFEAFTLPALKGQTDPDFTLLVVIGDDLPQPWRGRLEGLLAGLPQAVLRPQPPGPHRATLQQVINDARDRRPCIQFRMDDDDAVGLSFVARVRTAATDIAPLLRRHRLAAIDFTRGHVARPCAQGIEAEAVARQLWTPALAVVAAAGEGRTVMNFSHAKLWQFMPVLSLTDPDMFVRGLNDWNDSDLATGPAARLLDAEGEALFRRAYGIDADRVRALFGGAAG